MKKKRRTLLWKLECPGTEHSSFLFGTMHIRDSRAFPFRTHVLQVLRSCKVLASEFDLGETGGFDPASLNLPGHLRLDELIPPRRFEKVRRFLLKVTGTDLRHFLRKRPLIVAHILDEQLLPGDMPYSMDEDLWRFALEEGMATTGIETHGEQLAYLTQIDLQLQTGALIDLAENISRYRSQLKKLTRLYQEADPHRIFKAARKGMQGTHKVLLYKRNLLMADRISFLASDAPTFFAIGAGHLGGAKGVLRLLKLKGITLSPVQLDPSF